MSDLALKHAPGPWVASRSEPSKNQWTVHPQAGGGTGWHDLTDEENGYMSVSGIMREADARLISAAPDLLAALQSVMWMAEEWYKYSGCDATCADEYRRDLDRAKAALVKAGAQ